MVELLGKRRRRFCNSTLQLAGDLSGQPGLTLRTTSDHHGIGAGQFERDHGLSNEVMSPLTIRGTETAASLTARTATQSASPL